MQVGDAGYEQDDIEIECAENESFVDVGETRFKIVQSFLVVGAMLSADNTLYADLEYKLNSARKAFYASRDQLM
eukprot:11952419-Karenia_brevis.AAC.1